MKKKFAVYGCRKCNWRARIDVTNQSVACSEICPQCRELIYVEWYEFVESFLDDDDKDGTQ